MGILEKIEKAIIVALKAHKNQKRKVGGRIPYIVHPISVAMLLARHKLDEDVLAAAMLHDVIEDTDYKPAKLKKEFGTRVLRLVMEVTDKKPDDPWHKRKDAYLKHIKNASKEACFIACADKIHNLNSMAEAYRKFGDTIWKRFSASKEDKIAFYEAIYKEVKKRFSYLLVEELGCAVRRTKRILKIK